MVEKSRRERVDRADGDTPVPQWEVFVRDAATEPMRHVGSVAAGTATEAHEHASRLFGWYADDLWLCPADTVERFSTRPLSKAAETEASTGDGDRPDQESTEPRVYEETEGTPRGVEDSQQVTDS